MSGHLTGLCLYMLLIFPYLTEQMRESANIVWNHSILDGQVVDNHPGILVIGEETGNPEFSEFLLSQQAHHVRDVVAS